MWYFDSVDPDEMLQNATSGSALLTTEDKKKSLKFEESNQWPQKYINGIKWQ